MYMITYPRPYPDIGIVKKEAEDAWLFWIFDSIIVDVMWGFGFPVGPEKSIVWFSKAKYVLWVNRVSSALAGVMING